MTEQQIKNQKLRLALRTGALPYTFTDSENKRYRTIVWEMQNETGKKFTTHKDNDQWTINIALEVAQNMTAAQIAKD